jgi:hypothetical protein
MATSAVTKKAPKQRRMTLAEFQKSDVLGGDINALLSKFNGGSFMWCHTAIFESTGIWIEELVPVFQKLDAALVSRDLRPARQ